jgi:hypothetical protein
MKPWTILSLLAAFILTGLVAVNAQEKKEDGVELKLELPKPLFTGTPKELPPGVTVDKKSLGKPRGPFFVPKGVVLLSKDKPVTLSDQNPINGKPDMVTDGIKEGTDGNWVEMGPGLQWAQVDLGKAQEIHAILIWHYHADPRVFRDVVVQIADDPDFIENVRTLYNNDQDNSAGLGLGKDTEYFESSEGKLVEGKGTKARYIRAYSKGSTNDGQNFIIEMEVHGK